METREKKNVLVVEDDPSIRRMIARYLTELRVNVIEVADGRAAIARLTQQPPDLLCLDWMLPESSGYDVCEFVKQSPTLRNVPILLISARTSPSDRAQAEEAGASAYLTKPFSRADFVRQAVGLLNRGSSMP